MIFVSEIMTRFSQLVELSLAEVKVNRNIGYCKCKGNNHSTAKGKVMSNLTYANAMDLLARGRDGRKKLTHNTYLHETQDGVAVQLHNTDIVKIHKDNTYTLNSGGWFTVTTKARINEFSPARLGQDKGIWYLYVGQGQGQGWSKERIPFHDGMKINGDGKPLGAVGDMESVEAKKRKLDKLTRDYIKGFAADAVSKGKLTLPSGGDCWGCHFGSPQNVKGWVVGTPYMGFNLHTVNVKESEPMGVDHLLQHFEGKYYVPSLLLKAIESKGYKNPGVIWAMIESDLKRGETRMLKDVLRSYFRKRKPQLLEAM
jgi:hypothetical protein